MAVTQSEQFVVLTYNIRHGKGLDGVQDLGRIATVLQNSKAKLIGLQEVDKNNQIRSKKVDQSEFLARTLSTDYHFAPALGLQVQFGNAILSAFPVLEKETLFLPKKGTFEDRIVAIAKVLIGKQPVIFMNVHLGLARGERIAHVDLILNYLKKVAEPVILVGDLNEQPGQPAYNKLTECLVDAAAYTHQEQPTFPSLPFFRTQANIRIDYIFVSSQIKILNVEVPQVWASDHLPVRATLKLNYT